MFQKKSALVIFFALLFITFACNLPSAAPTEESEIENLALTITAQALLLLQPGSSDTQLTEEQQQPAEQFTATPELPAAPGATNTPSVPQVSVTTNTNCRTGPGTQYDLIDALVVGQTAEVVGKNTVTSYWIIKRPSSSGNCWLWGQYATVVGNTANLSEYPIPPSPTPKATNTPPRTPTPSVTPTPSFTSTPLFTFTPSNTPVPTFTFTPTNTPGP